MTKIIFGIHLASLPSMLAFLFSFCIHEHLTCSQCPHQPYIDARASIKSISKAEAAVRGPSDQVEEQRIPVEQFHQSKASSMGSVVLGIPGYPMGYVQNRHHVQSGAAGTQAGLGRRRRSWDVVAITWE